MRPAQSQFLNQFAERLLAKGFSRLNYDHTVVLEKRMTISGVINCKVLITWLPNSWPIVKTQVRIEDIMLSYDVTVGLLMDYAGGVDDILTHIVKRATEGLADIITKQL